jgi:hypothetical protein
MSITCAFFSDNRNAGYVTIPNRTGIKEIGIGAFAMNFLLSTRFRLLVCAMVFAMVYFNNSGYATWLTNSPHPAQAEESDFHEKTMYKIPRSKSDTDSEPGLR